MNDLPTFYITRDLLVARLKLDLLLSLKHDGGYTLVEAQALIEHYRDGGPDNTVGAFVDYFVERKNSTELKKLLEPSVEFALSLKPSPEGPNLYQIALGDDLPRKTAHTLKQHFKEHW